MVMIPSIHPFVPFIPGDKVTMDLTTLEGSDVSSSAGGSGDNSEDDGYGGLVKPCGGAEGSASASSDASSDAAAASTVSLSSTPPSAGRSRSASIDLLASAAFMTAPQVSQPPQPEKRERIDSISSLMEAVEVRQSEERRKAGATNVTNKPLHARFAHRSNVLDPIPSRPTIRTANSTNTGRGERRGVSPTQKAWRGTK